jgi:hypothetical protein
VQTPIDISGDTKNAFGLAHARHCAQMEGAGWPRATDWFLRHILAACKQRNDANHLQLIDEALKAILNGQGSETVELAKTNISR